MAKRIFLTGATGTMGLATLREIKSRNADVAVTVLARPSKRNRSKLAPFTSMPGFRIIWGDIMKTDDLAAGCADADFILHFAGLVSPKADYDARATLKINVGSTRLLVDALRRSGRADKALFVYIGSIAELGDCRPPRHWGRTGDPLLPAHNDPYALSKILAEKEVVDSGLPHWVVLRQTGILCPEILLKGSDPITFHVPLCGVLEWTTAEDTGNLIANICTHPLPEGFTNHFFNIGGGEGFRVTNYEFEKLLLKALHCPPPEKTFRPDWFALGNFHGQWWADSDRLEELLPYRRHTSIEEYFGYLKKSLPWWMNLAPLAPAPLIRFAMRQIAERPPLGPLSWPKNGDTLRINNAFGSLKQMQGLPSRWEDWADTIRKAVPEPPGSRFPVNAHLASHGYDESKPEDRISIEDMRQKAEFHGGECLSESMTEGDLAAPLRWRCSHGHEFSATPSAVLLGGHWCPECLVSHCAIPGVDYATLQKLIP